MNRMVYISRRVRLRFAVLAAFALLFQQCAFAAYFCTAAMPMATTHCAQMASARGAPAPMCSQHCARATPAPLPDAQAPGVPADIDPALPAIAFVAAPPASAPLSPRNAPHPSPPLTDLHCSRQI